MALAVLTLAQSRWSSFELDYVQYNIGVLKVCVRSNASVSKTSAEKCFTENFDKVNKEDIINCK